jgi:hypothetical protein
MGAPRWELVVVQIVEAQLSDSYSSTGSKSDKSLPHEQKSTKKRSTEVTIEKCYKGQSLLSLFLLFQRSKSIDMLKLIISIW